jgi:hypothetical protein
MPTIYLSIRPHIGLPLRSQLVAFVVDLCVDVLDVFFHDLSVGRGLGVPPTQTGKMRCSLWLAWVRRGLVMGRGGREHAI